MIIFYVLAFLTVLLFVIPIPILILITSKRHFSIWILKVNVKNSCLATPVCNNIATWPVS